ncbi:hypothetical protein HZS_5219 [Henneguya salminicola]|nr:hypothetical protein HZS_5219 [Henneguya salminicola]
MYMNIETFFIDRNEKFRAIFIKINTIIWNNYKFSDDTCCSKDQTCETPCPHLFGFSLNDQKFEHSYSYTQSKISKFIKYDYYHIFESNSAMLNKKLSMELYTMPEFQSDQFFDFIELKNLSLSQKLWSGNKIVSGKFGNIDMDITVGLINIYLF